MRIAPISVRDGSLANTREFRQVTGHPSGRQLVAPSVRIQLFSGPPAQTVVGPRRGGSLPVLVRGGTQGNTLQYRLPIYGARPYDRYLSTHVSNSLQCHRCVRAYQKTPTSGIATGCSAMQSATMHLASVVLDLGRAVRHG